MKTTTLKFTQIVEHAHLDQWTAQYVLKNPELIKGLPEGGSKGKHRIFTIEQAVNFALHTTLIMGGMGLKLTAEAMNHCRKTVRQAEHGGSLPSYQLADAGDSWKIEVLESRYVKISCATHQSKKGVSKSPRRAILANNMNPYFDVRIKDIVELGLFPLTKYEIDATLLEKRLVKSLEL